jgi:uncharacterized protein YoxC
VKLRRLAFVPLIAVLAVLAAGCGGKSSKPETTSDWANSFCSSVTTWKDSVTSAVSPLKNGNITKDSVNTAFDDFKSATDTFTHDVKGLGKPPTKAGDQAKQDVDQLTNQVDDGVDTIHSAVKNVSDVGSALAAVSTVTGALASMRMDVTTTYHNLQQIDASGELTSAFANAPDCKTLKNSVGNA